MISGLCRRPHTSLSSDWRNCVKLEKIYNQLRTIDAFISIVWDDCKLVLRWNRWRYPVTSPLRHFAPTKSQFPPYKRYLATWRALFAWLMTADDEVDYCVCFSDENIREFKHRRFRATNVNRNSKFLLFNAYLYSLFDENIKKIARLSMIKWVLCNSVFGRENVLKARK